MSEKKKLVTIEVPYVDSVTISGRDRPDQLSV
jgi:hypothetical protein